MKGDVSGLSIRKKILLGFFIGAVVPLFALEFLDGITARRELEMQQIEALDAIADLKQQRIETFFNNIAEDTFFLSHLEIITEPLPIVSEYYNNRDTAVYKEIRARLDRHLIPTRNGKNFLEIILADPEGRMVYHTGAVHNDDELGMSVEPLVPKDQFKREASSEHGHGHEHVHGVDDEVFVSDVFESPFAPSGFELVSAAPVYQEDGTYNGMIILAIDMGPVFDLILDTAGLGETGETLISRNEGDHALFINPLRHDPEAALSRKVFYDSDDALPTREATQGMSGRGVVRDYRQEEVIASWRPLELPSDDLTWGVVAKIDTSEAFAASDRLLQQAIFVGLGALVLIFISNVYLRRTIVDPLRGLAKAAGSIAEGKLSTRVKYGGNDEIGALGDSFNNMASQLSNVQTKLADQNHELESSVTLLEDQNKEIERSKKATLNILEDVQEEKDKTQREKERMATILNSIGDGVFVVDRDHVIKAINPVAAKLSGFSISEASNKPYKEILKFIYEESGKINDRFIVDAIKTGEVQEMSNHTLLVKRDGNKIPVADSAAPLKDEDGNVTGCVVVFRDVSKEHAIDKAKTEFVSLASHQLRTPLAAINWNLEMLLDEIKDDLEQDERQALDDVYASSVRMSELVTALLNVSRIELGTFAVDPEPTDIMNLSREIVKDLRPRIEQKNFNFVETYEPESLTIDIDPKLTRMVIENLLTNSVKYTPEGKKIEIAVRKEKTEITVRVTDEGYGIPKEQQDKIFTRLFRADNVQSKDTEGTGLGLYIVKSIVEHSGGKIWFESEEGAGTTFYVTLPLGGMSKKEGPRKLS